VQGHDKDGAGASTAYFIRGNVVPYPGLHTNAEREGSSLTVVAPWTVNGDRGFAEETPMRAKESSETSPTPALASSHWTTLASSRHAIPASSLYPYSR
jgi:hypothetical protein